MKNELAYCLLSLLTLVFAAAGETLLPKYLGVGFPLLLSAAAVTAGRDPAPRAVVFSAAAGAFEDAISSLPAVTSVVYFIIMAMMMRRFSLSRWSVIPFYVFYQAWLAAWVHCLDGGLCNRMVLSVPVAALTLLAVWPVMAWSHGKAVPDEA